MLKEKVEIVASYFGLSSKIIAKLTYKNCIKLGKLNVAGGPKNYHWQESPLLSVQAFATHIAKDGMGTAMIIFN